MSLSIINKETQAIIDRVLETYTLTPDQQRETNVQAWPRTTTKLDGDEEGMTFLGTVSRFFLKHSVDEADMWTGSPNGQDAGFLLAQHKDQLGGNKVISEITIFRADDVGMLPNLLSWVADSPASEESKASMGDMAGTEVDYAVVKRSQNVRYIVREHVFRARLRRGQIQ
jgi:hypothetical protein